jgi:hypothetical protein
MGTSSGKNNKSCLIFHNETSTIGFEFFCFLYDFLRNLQDSAKQQHYWRSAFAPGSLEFLFLSRIGPWFTKNTLERTREMQCSPWAWRAARLIGIGPLRWRPWPRKEWGRTRGSPAVDLWPEMGGEEPAAGRPAAHHEHDCGGLCSDEFPV